MTGKKRTGTSNIHLIRLINSLRKHKKGIWKRLAADLEKPTRIRREVNLTRINRNSNDGEIIAVPGKVLADGILEKKIEVAAYKFSEAAKAKIEKSGSKIITIEQLLKKHPGGKGVKILG
jgi:large subunit ribosomal protein L18e